MIGEGKGWEANGMVGRGEEVGKEVEGTRY